jgi:hypothetical protein
MSRIYLSPHDVRDLERELLLAAMDSGWAAPMGPDLAAFERDTAQVCCVAQDPSSLRPPLARGASDWYYEYGVETANRSATRSLRRRPIRRDG